MNVKLNSALDGKRLTSRFSYCSSRAVFYGRAPVESQTEVDRFVGSLVVTLQS